MFFLHKWQRADEAFSFVCVMLFVAVIKTCFLVCGPYAVVLRLWFSFSIPAFSKQHACCLFCMITHTGLFNAGLNIVK